MKGTTENGSRRMQKRTRQKPLPRAMIANTAIMTPGSSHPLVNQPHPNETQSRSTRKSPAPCFANHSLSFIVAARPTTARNSASVA